MKGGNAGIQARLDVTSFGAEATELREGKVGTHLHQV